MSSPILTFVRITQTTTTVKVDMNGKPMYAKHRLVVECDNKYYEIDIPNGYYIENGRLFRS